MSRPETINRPAAPALSAAIFAAAISTALVPIGNAAHAADPPQAPAPIGVFGADMPAKGKLVVTLAPSFTRMQGIKIGDQWVKAPYIVTNVPSAFTPVGLHNLRMAPHALSTDTQTLSLAYGLTSDVTLFASTGMVEKSVNMEAFKGLTGTTPLGYKVGSTSGVADTTLATVVRLHQDQVNRFNINLGLSLPTASDTEDISLLLPNGTAPSKRAFYAMQPGTGTVDALAGAAYSGVCGPLSWGLSYRARIPLDDNAQGWRYGDLHEANAWGGYTLAPGIEATLRLNGTVQGAIHGQDPSIRGYAQGANPNFYGGQQLSLFAGAVVSGQRFGLKAFQFGAEAGAPLYQQLNGPQLARAWQVNLAIRYRR